MYEEENEVDMFAESDAILASLRANSAQQPESDPFAESDLIMNSVRDGSYVADPQESDDNMFAESDNILAELRQTKLDTGGYDEVQGTKVFGAAVDATIGSFQKGGALVAGALGFDELEDRWREAGEENQERSTELAYKSKYGDSGWEQFKNITDGEWWEQTIAQLAPGSAPFLAGAGTGGAAGAAVGSVFPVIGTAVGAVVGAMLGGGGTLFLQTMGDSYYDYLEDNPGDTDGAIEYSMVKSGATAILNAASIPLGLAGVASGTLKNSLMNAALKVFASEATTETADTLSSNVIDRAYIDPDIPISRGVAESIVGGLLFDAPAIAVAGRKGLKSVAEPLDVDEEQRKQIFDDLQAIEDATEGDKLDKVTASSKALSEMELRDPNVRVKKLIDEETGEVIYEERQTQAQVDAEAERIQQIQEEDKVVGDSANEAVIELGKQYQIQEEEAKAAEAAKVEAEAKQTAEEIEAAKPIPLDPLAEVDLKSVDLTRKMMLNGKEVDVTRKADRWQEQLEKRRSVVDEVAKCLAN